MLALHLTRAVVWNEAAHGDAAPADCSVVQTSYSPAQSMLGADPLTGVTGSVSGRDAADTFTFHAFADGTLTVAMTQFSTQSNSVQPALFLFHVTGTAASPIYTPLVGSRRYPNSGPAWPSVSISPANGRYMIAVTMNSVVPRNAAKQNLWQTPNNGLLNVSPIATGNLNGWSATSNANTPTQTYTLAITYTSTAPGFVFGDPHFKGYKGQSFDFQGLPGHAYQLYSDDKVALNVEMISWTGPAKKVAPNSTVVGRARLFFGMHFIELETTSFNRTDGTLLLKTDAGEQRHSSDTRATELFDCINIVWHAPKLAVLHGQYEMRVSWSFRSYNNGTFLNVELDVPESVLAGNQPRGGLLGQTLIDGLPSLDSRNFGISALERNDAKTNLFHPVSNTCHR